jgi:hypothetical protein
VTREPDKESVMADLDYTEVDQEIVPYLKRINAMSDLFTVYSCSGHGYPGYVMLRGNIPRVIKTLSDLDIFIQLRDWNPLEQQWNFIGFDYIPPPKTWLKWP